MLPFDSSKFFFDPFFSESVSINSKTYQAVIEDLPLLTPEGNIIQRTGDHLRIYLQTTLDLKTVITARGATYIVEMVEPSGDTACHTCIKSNSQRRK